MKIRFFQLELEAYLSDSDFVAMTSAERGVYDTLIFNLYKNNGKCKFDTPFLAKLCGCGSCEEFEKIWNKISEKFQLRNGWIKHKRVTKELTRAKKFLQSQRRAGLKGAEKRWHRHSSSNGTGIACAIANEKRNLNVKESKDSSNTNTTINFSPFPNTARSRGLMFNEALIGIIPPRSQSDRTCFRNVTNWLMEGIAAGRFDDDIFERVLSIAKEAKDGRKPAAVFMALMKKDLHYQRQASKDL